MKKIWLLSLLFVSTVTWAQNFLITTKNREIIKKIENVSVDKFNKGRVHVVGLKKGVTLLSLPTEIQKNLKKINLNDVSSYVVQSKESPDPAIKEIIDGVSKDRIESSIVKLNSYKSRRMYSDGNIEATEWLKNRFQDMGLETKLHCFKNSSCNVIGKKDGDRKYKTIIIIGHMDTVGRDYAGADDNASGTAGVLEMAQILLPLKLKTSLLFIAVNGEESGLLGSAAHVKKLKADGTINQIGHVINMDMIGYNDGKNILDIETDTKYVEFGNFLAQTTSIYSDLTPRVNTPAWGSDHVPYIKAGIPSLLTIEDWDNHNPCYHRSCDTLEKVDLDYAATIIKINLAAVLLKNR